MPEMTIAEFINRSTPGHICPFCGTQQWNLVGERGILVPNEKGEFTLPCDIDRAFMTECTGCGFVRFIRPYNMIQRAIEAQKDQENPAPLEGDRTEKKAKEKNSK
jgi:hypothetical protein